MGTPDARQIDGLGGANPLTSKVAIVSPSRTPGIDVDYLFAQVFVDRPLVSYSQNCGNILAGIGYFAIERGLVAPYSSLTIFGVTKMSSSALSFWVSVERNRTPANGISPRNGTLFTVSRRSVS